MISSHKKKRIKLNGKCQRASYKICIDKVWAEGYFKALLYDVLRCDAEMASGYSLWCQERILMEWRLSSMATDSRWVSSPVPGFEHLRFWCNFNPQIFVGIHPEVPPCATVGHHVSMWSIRLVIPFCTFAAKVIFDVFYSPACTWSSSGIAVQLLAFANSMTCVVILCWSNIAIWGFRIPKGGKQF